jgi:hypothetical protein
LRWAIGIALNLDAHTGVARHVTQIAMNALMEIVKRSAPQRIDYSLGLGNNFSERIAAN